MPASVATNEGRVPVGGGHWGSPLGQSRGSACASSPACPPYPCKPPCHPALNCWLSLDSSPFSNIGFRHSYVIPGVKTHFRCRSIMDMVQGCAVLFEPCRAFHLRRPSPGHKYYARRNGAEPILYHLESSHYVDWIIPLAHVYRALLGPQ